MLTVLREKKQEIEKALLDFREQDDLGFTHEELLKRLRDIGTILYSAKAALKHFQVVQEASFQLIKHSDKNAWQELEDFFPQAKNEAETIEKFLLVRIQDAKERERSTADQSLRRQCEKAMQRGPGKPQTVLAKNPGYYFELSLPVGWSYPINVIPAPEETPGFRLQVCSVDPFASRPGGDLAEAEWYGPTIDDMRVHPVLGKSFCPVFELDEKTFAASFSTIAACGKTGPQKFLFTTLRILE